MAHELEVLRIESSFMRGAFCNIARATVEDITQTFDNLLFYPGEDVAIPVRESDELPPEMRPTCRDVGGKPVCGWSNY
jgi:hypothetical protein